jgi:SAM-dependent methyltransferase
MRLSPRTARTSLALTGIATLAMSLGMAPQAAPPTPAATPQAPVRNEEPVPPSQRAPGTTEIRGHAQTIYPNAVSVLGGAFLQATASLPEIKPRVVWRSKDRTKAISDAAYRALPESERAEWEARPCDTTFYWNTGYGSPLTYLRIVDLLAINGHPTVAGKKIADFGCGQIGHLRLLASLGAETHGIDVEPLLGALYSEPGDTGPVAGRMGRDGSVALHIGRWPADQAIKDAVGGDYDIFMSKNTLKRGYIKPEREVDPKFLVHLGVDEEAYLKAVHDALKPGGIFVLYNICPAQNPPDKPYLPHADGRSPWDRAAFEKAGFDVVALDENDIVKLIPIWRALGYHDGADYETIRQNLFVWYTIVRKKADPAPAK